VKIRHPCLFPCRGLLTWIECYRSLRRMWP
jgi:hypothetical protein